MKLPLDPTIRINDCRGRDRQQRGDYKGSVRSASHLICINTSGMSESHKAVIMSGQIRPSPPTFNLHICISLVSLGREEMLDLEAKLVTLKNGSTAVIETSQADHRHFPNRQPDSTPSSILHEFLGTQKDLQ